HCEDCWGPIATVFDPELREARDAYPADESFGAARAGPRGDRHAQPRDPRVRSTDRRDGRRQLPRNEAPSSSTWRRAGDRFDVHSHARGPASVALKPRGRILSRLATSPTGFGGRRAPAPDYEGRTWRTSAPP